MSAARASEKLLAQIRLRLPSGQGFLPADPLVLGPLLGLSEAPVDLQRQIDELLEEGSVRRVLVGVEPHLVLGVARRTGHLSVVTVTESTPPPVADQAPAPALIKVKNKKGPKRRIESELQKGIAQDQEAERIILLRVGVVILSIVALLLVRALALE